MKIVLGLPAIALPRNSDDCFQSSERVTIVNDDDLPYPSVCLSNSESPLWLNHSFSDVNHFASCLILMLKLILCLWIRQESWVCLLLHDLQEKKADGSDLPLWKVPLVEFYLDGLVLSDEFLGR